MLLVYLKTIYSYRCQSGFQPRPQEASKQHMPQPSAVRCETCGALLPPKVTEKQRRQHEQTRQHKRGQRRPDDEADEEVSALCSELSGLSLPDSVLQSYADNRRRYRALCGEPPAATAEGIVLLPPPVLRNPKRECPSLDRPFLSAQCGCIPLVPTNLEETLQGYFAGRKDAHPKVTIDEEERQVDSWTEARRTLQAAEAQGRRFWCTFYLPEMGHPVWWPKMCKGPDGAGEGPGSAPTQDQVIIGRGQTGIGVHADKYDVGPRRLLCSTCITIVRGRKHV